MVQISVVFTLFLAATVNSAIAGVISTKDGCTVNVNKNLGSPQPLILKPGKLTDSNAFYVPTEEDNIIFEDKQVAVVACPGSTVQVNGSSTREFEEATCQSGLFEITNKSVDFGSITCSKLPYHTARYTGTKCLQNNREIEIGFELKDGRFIQLIKICFDDVNQNSLYSFFNMTKGIVGYQNGFPRPSFIPGNFYNLGGKSINTIYERKEQTATVNTLVGLPASSTKYIHDNDDYYLARGHLSAKADFVFGSQQRATFHYVNISPQWQTFNGGNWNTLEQDIRKYVGSIAQKDLVVYAGTYGVTTLPHEETGEDVEIYLYADGKNRGIAVPQVFWRIIYDPTLKEAIAFVGVNNPYRTNVNDDIFCKDICDKYKWVSWKAQDLQLGYGYCCDVNELRKTITNIPDFPVEDILS